MSELVTKEFRLHNAEQFREQFSEAVADNVYLFIGRPQAWPTDSTPPALSNNVKEIYYNPYDNMIAMKRVIASDVSLASPRYNWATGTVYAEYTSHSDFFSGQFYVITDEYKVYKCLSNNNGSQSTVKPTSTSTDKFTLGDGYIWKYMLTLDAVDAVKFLTSDFFPVKYLTTDNGSLQWDVQTAATSGSIDTVSILVAGTGYLSHSDNVVDASSNSVTLDTTASSTNSVYNNYSIYILSGTGAGQMRTISTYTGATRIATISTNWSTQPDTTSVYIVSPRVTATGNGTGFTAYTTVTSGGISGVIPVTSGSGYSQIALTIVGQTGSGASVAGNISPVSGHGANAVNELYAHNCALNVKMIGTESDLVSVNSDFRVTGLIVNPKLAANTSVNATSLVYDMTTKVTTSPPTGTFVADETITGQTSGTTATVVNVNSSTLLSVTGASGSFSNGEVIIGNISGASATISSVTNPLVSKYSGRVVYIRNQTPVYRSSDQTEEYRIVVKF